MRLNRLLSRRQWAPMIQSLLAEGPLAFLIGVLALISIVVFGAVGERAWPGVVAVFLGASWRLATQSGLLSGIVRSPSVLAGTALGLGMFSMTHQPSLFLRALPLIAIVIIAAMPSALQRSRTVGATLILVLVLNLARSGIPFRDPAPGPANVARRSMLLCAACFAVVWFVGWWPSRRLGYRRNPIPEGPGALIVASPGRKASSTPALPAPVRPMSASSEASGGQHANPIDAWVRHRARTDEDNYRVGGVPFDPELP